MKRILTVLLAGCLCLSLCACNFGMDGSYSSVKPHTEEYDAPQGGSAEVSSYEELLSVLSDLVRNGTQAGVLYISEIPTHTLGNLMEKAIRQLCREDAMAAYAVDQIQYEVGTNAGRTAIAVDIAYIHSRAEILRIRKAENTDEALELIAAALENCDAGTVINIAEYTQLDFAQKVQDYVDANPDRCMETPQVTAAIYPETGDERVVELTFTYQTSRDALREMQSYVKPVFEAADLNVSGEETEEAKFSLMYAFLMERSDYQVETSITPAYSLLRHGVGDSRAFATVYAAMCRRADLDCLVVTGTREAEPWTWNIICEDGIYYHVDLINSVNGGRLHKLTEDEMNGYVWDYSAYPATGTPVEPAAESETE